MQSYLLKFTLFILANALCLWLWNNYGPLEWTNNHGWIVLVALSIVSFVMHKALQSKNNTEAQFVRKFIAGTGIKMMICLLMVLFYGIINRPEAPGFIFIVLFHYITFLVFEVWSLMSFLKSKK